MFIQIRPGFSVSMPQSQLRVANMRHTHKASYTNYASRAGPQTPLRRQGCCTSVSASLVRCM